MENESNNVTISVCTYNILADRYALKKTFSYCDRKFLHWKSHRRHLVLSELSKLHCDVIFLQEVDRINDIENYLRGQKYFTTYYQRPNRKNDGLLIAFKSSKFELDSSVYIVNYNNLCSPQNMLNKLRFTKDNIGMILILKSIINPKLRVVLANTHLYWNPNMEDVKLFQTASFLNSIQWVINKHNLTNYKIIIGGDFNSQPMSNVYQLIINGFKRINDIQQQQPQNDDNSEIKTDAECIDNNNDIKHKKDTKLLRIICDRDLRKTAQWLSLIEIDAAYFGDNSTTNYCKLFEIARSENRIIVTRNTRITSRSDCPKFLLIGPRETQREAYQHVVNYFGITINFKKKQYRDTIEGCLKCPKCLKQLIHKTLEDIKNILPSQNENLLNGKSCKGNILEFYQCSNPNCGHLVYHREGWLDRLHHKRQEHYNSTKNLHKQFQNNNNIKQQRENDGILHDEHDDIENKTDKVSIWCFEDRNGGYQAFEDNICVILDRLKIGEIYKHHLIKHDDTMYEIKKIGDKQCESRNTKTNDKMNVIYKELDRSNDDGKNGKDIKDKYNDIAIILKDHVYRKRRPIIIGIEIINGFIKKYDRIFAVKDENLLDLGMISEIQDNGSEIKQAKNGKKVCIKLDTEHSYGRQFDHTYYLVVQSRKKLINNEKDKLSVPIQIVPIDNKLNTYPNIRLNQLKHSLKLKSVYYSLYGKEPKTTNHTEGFSGCLDYLFVSMDTDIKHCDKIPEPLNNNKDDDGNNNDGDGDRNENGEYLCNYLPDRYHPSDHLPIKAILQI